MSPRAPAVSHLRLPTLSRHCLPHVHVAHLDPGGIVDDAVHDRVRVHAAAEPRVPVLLSELRAQDGRCPPVAQFEKLQQHPPEQLVRPLRQPLVDYEQAERPVLPQQLPLAAGPVAALAPEVLEVGLPYVAGPDPLGAGRLGERTREVGLAGASSGPRGRPRERRSPMPRCPRARACPSSGASARRATFPPCQRTSPRCSGSRGALGRFRTSSARRHPSTVYHSLCPGARSSPPSFPGGLAKVTAQGKHTARAAPPVPGARPSCLNCSIFRAHGAHFPVITRTTS